MTATAEPALEALQGALVVLISILSLIILAIANALKGGLETLF